MEEAKASPPAELVKPGERDYLLFLSYKSDSSQSTTLYLPLDIAGSLDNASTQQNTEHYLQRPEPSTITWSAKAILKEDALWSGVEDTEHRCIIVATDMPDIGAKKAEGKESYLPPPTVWYYDELLKSAIQKAVRRRKSWTGRFWKASSI